MTNIEKVKEYVRNHEACKHLKKLSEGCFVYVNVDDIQRFGSRVKYVTSKGKVIYTGEQKLVVNNGYYLKTYTKTRSPFSGKSRITKIIGHPPTLADYLLVLKDFEGREFGGNWLLSTDGKLYFKHPDRVMERKLTFSLTGEPLDEENSRKFLALVGNK